MNTTDTNPGGKSAAQIEGEVEQTRASVSDTLNALRGKLEPSQIVDEVVDRVAGYARGSGGVEFAQNLGSAMRDNPLPVLLIGAGISWLMLSKATSDTGRVTRYEPARFPRHADAQGLSRSMAGETGGDRMSTAVDGLRDSATQVSDKVSDAASRAVSYAKTAGSAVAAGVSDATNRASETVGALGARASDNMSSVRDGVESVRERASSVAQGTVDRFDDLVEAQPLLTGVLGLALGVAFGALLPRTRTEDDLMGEARDAVMDRVSGVAQDSYDDLRDTVGDQVETAKAAVADTYSRAKEKLDTDGVSRAGEVLRDAAGNVLQTVDKAVTGVAEHVNRKVEKAGAPPQEGSSPG